MTDIFDRLEPEQGDIFDRIAGGTPAPRQPGNRVLAEVAGPVASGLMAGGGGLFKTLDQTISGIEGLTGARFKTRDFATVSNWFGKHREYWQDLMDKEGVGGVRRVVGEIVGSLPGGIAEWETKVPVAALAGAGEAVEKGKPEEMLNAAIRRGGERFILGDVLKKLGGVKSPVVRRGLGAATLGGTAAVHGADPTEIAVQGILGGLMANKKRAIRKPMKQPMEYVTPPETSSAATEPSPTWESHVFRPRVRAEGEVGWETPAVVETPAAAAESKPPTIEIPAAERIKIEKTPPPGMTKEQYSDWLYTRGSPSGKAKSLDFEDQWQYYRENRQIAPPTAPVAEVSTTEGDIPRTTRNIDTAAVRVEEGLPPLERGPSMSLTEHKATWQEAAPPSPIVDELTKQIVDKGEPYSLSAAETQGFERRIKEVTDARDKLIAEAKDLPDGSVELKANLEARKTFRDQIDKLTQATRLAGTAWSQTGLSRQNPLARLLEEEMSPTAMEARAAETKGRHLTPDEVKDVHTKAGEVKAAVERAEQVRKIETTRKANQVIRKGRSRYSKMTEAEKDAELAELTAKAKDPATTPDDLNKLYYNMAMNLGSRPGVRGVSDVAARLQSEFDGINRYSLSDAIVNATSKVARNVDETRLLLQALRREAHTDKRLRTAIDDVLWHLENKTVPEPNRSLQNETADIRTLRETLAYYKGELKNSEPAQVAKYERLISILDNRIKSGDFTIKERGPVSEVVADLQAKYKRLQAEFNRRAKVSDNTAKMQKLEKEIAALEKRAEAGAYQKMPRTERPRELDELDEFRSRKTALQTEMNRQAAAHREIDTLRATIKSLQEHLNAGTAPQKTPKIGEREPAPMAVALREIVATLRKRIAESGGGQKARLEKQLARLQEQLRTRDYRIPTRGEKPLRSVELEKLDYKIQQARQELRQRIAKLDNLGKRFKEHPFHVGTQWLREIQAWKSSVDMSALRRQGGIYAVSHPIRTLRKLPEAMRAVFDPVKAHAIQNEIFNGERAWWYKRVGLDFTEYDGMLTAREEAFAGNLIERVPGIKHLVKGSNRGFVTLLNLMRRDSFDAMEQSFAKRGGLSLEEAKGLAYFVNVMTGRGSVKGLEPYLPALNGALWSPRYTLSRFQYLGLFPLLQRKVTWRVRTRIAREYAQYLGGVAAAMFLYESVFGGKVERDPRSADFGKIVIGNTRLDPLSGLSQVSVLLSRLGAGQTKTQRGQVVSLNPSAADFPYRGDTRASILERFARSKLGFAPGLAWNIIEGKNFVGEPITLGGEVGRALVPLAFEDVLKLMKDQGVPKGLALTTLNLFGESVQTYTPRPAGMPAGRKRLRKRLRR